MKINAESQKSIIKIELFVNEHMSNYFQIHESRWKNAYIVGDEKDVLQRLIQCGDEVKATDIFRVTSESPFIFYEMMNLIYLI